MGTRNLTLVQLDGAIRVAQYCQRDGYPSGQGATVLAFLEKHREDLQEFERKVSKTKSLSQDEITGLWKTFGADDSGFVSMDISDQFNKAFPHLHRNCGADVLEIILNSPDGLGLSLNTEFAGDSLFCEYAYLINLDTKELEFYSGFNKSPLTEEDRFFFLQGERSEYYPIRLVQRYGFDALPSVKGLEAGLEAKAKAA